MPWPGKYSLIKQWFGAPCGDVWKTLSLELTGKDSSRGIMGSESQVGRTLARSVLVGERGDGWA